MTNKNLILLGLLFYSCASYAIARDSESIVKPVFYFNGMELGDELSEEFFNKNCPTELKNNEEIECKKRVVVDDINMSVVYFFYNKKLLGIKMKYPSTSYSDLINIYTNKFSQLPHNNSSEEILLNTGEKYLNEKASWDTTSGKFVIAKYWNNLKNGSAQIVSSDYEKYKIEKMEVLEEGFFKTLYKKLFD